ncbi:MAG: hypothetical protein IPO21_13245 [Bacteroidales bacterium]|nr:hypothetical protein [Bacteroidales bacterium]
MIKKLTAYSFILLANLVLLAHAVLPHHHHEQQVCIESTHCDGDSEAHIHNTASQDHQHDGADNTICVLKQAVIVPSSQVKSINTCDNCSDNHNHDFIIHSDFGNEHSQFVSEVISYKPEFPSFYTTFVTPTLGLRAPPIV